MEKYKSHTKTMNLRYLQHGFVNLDYLMDHSRCSR